MTTRENPTPVSRRLLLISLHGLIRGKDLELGRDADTGGQTKYVVDLARSLAARDDVAQVDLVTRRVIDDAVSDDYAKEIEPLGPKARIVRIEAGPHEYIPKEQLWDHLDSFSDNLLDWLHTQPHIPDLVHSHYADAGYAGVRVASLLGVPLVHTGHSLGRDKRKRLLARGMSRAQIENTYNIGRRIDAEEEILANADLVITSTRNEIEEQYGLYNFYDPQRMRVIPPGIDLRQFYPPTGVDPIPFCREIARFLEDPDKPIILALSRPDERKNILTLLDTFGESAELQDAANLLIIAGSRDDIRDMDSGAQEVLTNILLLIDSYDLYGKVAVPKHHRPEEVPQIYRLAAASKGVFINPALTEPFGLTLLEAAASGLPLVATENGGPVDIIGNCGNGTLIDPLDKDGIADALLYYLQDRDAWALASANGLKGVAEKYTWEAHTETYMQQIETLQGKYRPLPATPVSQPAIRYRDRAIFSDLDQNLIGDVQALQRFSEVIRNHHRRITFGVATGRRLDSALALIGKNRLPTPDVLITSLGTRIHYGQRLIEDDYWADHIDNNWSPNRIRRVLGNLDGLELQPKQALSPFKISYYYDPRRAPSVDEIVTLLRQQELAANVIFSFGQFIDIVPSRASKGQALRYVAQRLDIPLEHILVAGGSGADEDMMRGNTLAVVLGNRHGEELSELADTDQKHIYFAKQPYAAGILEAAEHYDFFNTCIPPGET